jgi:O-acetylhomoserine (thiol)-lyase
MGGHGDALGGSLTDTGLFDWSRFPNIAEAYRHLPPAAWGMQQIRKKGLRDFGGTMRPEDAHRISLGMETLSLRLERACANADALARFLERHPAVHAVHYPGLSSHPQHAQVRRHFHGMGGTLLSFELRADISMHTVLDALKIIILSSHVSDTRTLAIPVAQTIFHEAGAARRAQMGIADELIRVTVGIENLDDLTGDLSHALDAGLAG